jgi:hypothetical protein
MWPVRGRRCPIFIGPVSGAGAGLGSGVGAGSGTGDGAVSVQALNIRLSSSTTDNGSRNSFFISFFSFVLNNPELTKLQEVTPNLSPPASY